MELVIFNETFFQFFFKKVGKFSVTLWSVISTETNVTEAITRGVLYKKGALKNFAILTGKHLYQVLLNKVAGKQHY